ncbi:unnamed protein product [Choristocarpus tenellus]
MKQGVRMATENLVEATMDTINVYVSSRSLFTVYGEVLGSKGDNTSKIHLSKEKTEKVASLTTSGQPEEGRRLFSSPSFWWYEEEETSPGH